MTEDTSSLDASRRIGFVVPSGNTACERELNRLTPPGISFHAARMRFAAGTRTGDMSAFFVDALREPIDDLASCDVSLTLLACSTATMAMTLPALAALAERAPGGLLDVLDASSQALKHSGSPPVALFTPYTEPGTAALRERLEADGIEVVATRGLGLDTSPERFRTVSRITPESLRARVLDMNLRDAKAVFIGCCDLPTLDAIPALEAELDIPVISMIQALFWAAMVRMTPSAPLPWRPGRLLAGDA